MIILKDVTLAFPVLAEPSAYADGKPKYSAQLSFSKEDKENTRIYTEEVNKAILAGKAKYGTLYKLKADYLPGKQLPTNVKIGLRDGTIEKPEVESLKNCWFFNATNLKKPRLFTLKRDEEVDAEAFYPGCIVNVKLHLVAFCGISTGVSNFLQAIQLTGKGTPIGKADDIDFDYDFEGI